MNKSIIIKGSIIIGLFLLVIGAAVGCSLITQDATEPTISNGSDVYLTQDDFTITNAQLWDVMKNVDGLNYLMDYVDHIVLEDAIDAVTDIEVSEEVRYLTYQTESEDLIAEIMEDADLNQDYLDAFNQNLIILGFDPTNDEDLRTFVEVGIAKTNLAREFMLNATGDDVYALSDLDIAEYFELINYGDVCALEVRFESENEANLVFDYFNLVPNFNLGIGEYYGELPIDEVASDGFLLDFNTTQLTEDEIFAKYVLMYNYMNPLLPQIPEDINQYVFCDGYEEISSYNYDDMIKDRTTGEPYLALTTYIFDTLTTDTVDGGLRFSYSPQTIGDASVYVYKISETEKVLFEDLTDTEILELKNEMLDLMITTVNIEDVVDSINEDIEFEIFDPYLALKYEYDTGITFDNDGSETLVARIGDEDITADQLYAYMENRVGVFYSIELVKNEMILSSDAYTNVYGDDYDFMDSNLDLMVENRDELRTMKSTFAQDGYASYGFSSAQYTWEEFIYLAFNVKTETEVIQQLFAFPGLQTQVIYPTINYDYSSDYIQDQSDDYFSLNAHHLLVYLDKDLDFTPDDFEDYKASLTVDETATFEALKAAFDNLIFTKMNDGLTLEEVVDEYQDSLMNDAENEWADFKQYGFRIMTEDLTPADENGLVTSLNHINSVAFDEAFQASLKRIYDAYVVEAANAATPITEYLDPQITESAFGLHLILATEGSTFEQFSAEYDPTEDTEGIYSVGSGNTSEIPNETQIGIYNAINYATIGGEFTDNLLPPEVYQSINAYYGATFEAYFTQTGYSIVSINYMLDNGINFTNDNTAGMDTLQNILDVLYIVNFPEGFVVTD